MEMAVNNLILYLFLVKSEALAGQALFGLIALNLVSIIITLFFSLRKYFCYALSQVHVWSQSNYLNLYLLISKYAIDFG